MDKLRLDHKKLQSLLRNKFRKIKLKAGQAGLDKIKITLGSYVSDENDAHIRDFNITVSTPAQFLEYLRSLQ